MTQFTLRLDLYSHGWLRAVVSQGTQNFAMDISYLSDAPSILAETVLCLLRSPMQDKALCAWQCEPGEYRWKLHRTEAGVLIEILWFEDCFSRLPDARGERVFQAECSRLRLATQVKGQLHRSLNEHGKQGYAARWKHSFPIEAFEQIEDCINILKHSSSDKKE